MKKTINRLFGIAVAVFLSVVLFTIPAFAAPQQTVGVAGEQLDANTQTLCLALKEEIAKIANGERASASIEIDKEVFSSAGIKTEWTSADLGVDSVTAGNAPLAIGMFWEQFEDFDKILDVLLHDCPYELYWFDKTTGTQYSTPYQYSTETVEIQSINYFFSVSNDYRADGYDPSSPTVDTAKTTAASEVIAFAQQIVAEYAELSDYDKLIAYRNEICELVTYNDDAASSSYTGGYGDPWQLIYVFDGDPNTNVVCEGYAKAFQLLCELSDFAKDVVCYTVTGNMVGGTGAGGHMWNVVAMGDGAYYLVDVTNSDEGTVGQDGELFLSGYNGAMTNGYMFVVGNTTISFVYDQDTMLLWGTDSTSVLRLSTDDYEAPAIEIDLPDTIVYSGNALTVGVSDADIIYRGSSSLTGEYEWSYVWYASGQEMTEAPRNAGSYLLEVTAVNLSDPSEIYQQTETVTIEKAMPSYTVPSGLQATYGDTLADITLPTGFSWNHPLTTEVGSVGEAGFLVNFTPTDQKNYETVTNIPVTVTVQKAVPTYQRPTGLTATFGDLLSDVILPGGFAWQTSDETARIASVGANTFYAVYTPADTENYETVRNIEVEIAVSKRDISDAVITLDGSLTYSGEVLTQLIKSVTVDGMDITYSVSGNTATEVGTYTLTVTGTGNFAGSATATWEIKGASVATVGGSNAPNTIKLTGELPWMIIGVAGGAVLLITIIVIAVLVKKKR